MNLSDRQRDELLVYVFCIFIKPLLSWNKLISRALSSLIVYRARNLYFLPVLKVPTLELFTKTTLM